VVKFATDRLGVKKGKQVRRAWSTTCRRRRV